MSSLLKRGAFILSLDTELAWGSAHGGKLKEREVFFQQTRPCIKRLIQLLEKYQIHATWAMVGHLFLDRCQPVNGIKHPEIIRPNYTWYQDDWLSPDPCSDIDAAPIWYGRDIIQQVLDCNVSQEIGCHTFSHVQAGEPGCTRECFSSELRACRVEADKLSVNLQSFVYPRNSVGYLDELAKAGFTAYRGPVASWFEHLPGIFSRAGHLLDTFLPIAPPVVSPLRENGIWNLPASYFYPPADRWWKLLPVSLQVGKARQGLRQAAKQRQIFHLWFHPFNLASNPDKLLGGLERIFSEVSRYREDGLLDNPTMGEMAHNLQLQSKQ
jgi:peptidoglycan/xylan/chitin deacetylase (PgdA/CDA1 family)